MLLKTTERKAYSTAVDHIWFCNQDPSVQSPKNSTKASLTAIDQIWSINQFDDLSTEEICGARFLCYTRIPPGC